MNQQLDLFAEVDTSPSSAAAASVPAMLSLAGIEVQLPKICQCGSPLALVGPGAGPHAARLNCRTCNRHRGWLSRASYEFLFRTILILVRPKNPIIIRRGNDAAMSTAMAADVPFNDELPSF
jgi:hypothetical protein